MKAWKLAAAVAASVVVFAAPSSFAKDGVYQSTADGHSGKMTVQVTIKSSKIADVKVLKWPESYPLATEARDKTLSEIMSTQKLDGPILAGATFSIHSIRQAVSDCLRKARLSPARYCQYKCTTKEACKVCSR